MLKDIIIKGAKENNLKNIDLKIPRNKLVVFTGVSGSGKSTLAFDTIFAEGQRRYIESLSSYARQFLGQMSKPNVDSIEGLSPSISIDQKTTSHNPRSTVGTVTEIYDYYRLLFAHVGTPYCPNCNVPITSQNIDSIISQILQIGDNEKIMITSPIVRGKKGTFVKELENFKKEGFIRVIVDDEIRLLDEEIVLQKNIKHNISVVVDRIAIDVDDRTRITDSVETALGLSDGLVVIKHNDEDILFSTKHACVSCGYSLEEISPRIFSFNSPFGACQECAGIGHKAVIDENKLIKNKNLSIKNGGLNVSGWNIDAQFGSLFYKAVAKMYNQSIDTPIKDLPKEMIEMILYGTKGEKIEVTYGSASNPKHNYMKFEGLIPNLTRRYYDSQSMGSKEMIGKLMTNILCPSCKGKRLKPEVLSIKINDVNIHELSEMSVAKTIEFFDNLKLNETQNKIAKSILKEIKARLNFLNNVGLNYLTINRTAGTLSGGESQRIRLATQIGAGLTGVLYILDEPSIGLHQRDNDRLLMTLENLRDLDNTVIVVEHDEDTIKKADYIVDIGPYAGINGGNVVTAGSLQDVIDNPQSITGKYLSGSIKIEVPKERRKLSNNYVEIIGAKQNNLKNLKVKIPVGVITAITGVSGSGKSSLVNGILYPAASNELNRSSLEEGKYTSIVGLEHLDKVINIDQSPIGRTPRSNPATYTNVFTDIRNLFASTISAKERGYTASRFSFNVKGGRCENCRGGGINKIEMYFLPDIYVSCDVCGGKRYNRETLEVKYKGKSIYDILEMNIEQALKFFENNPRIKKKLQTLYDVGLGYIKLGQPATELSGGEAQRVKLAAELSKRNTGKSLYILDEPTTGLHMYDVHKLVHILNRLVEGGNTIVVIEHNLDVIKMADYIIDLGPEGGDQGGTLVASGTPEEVSKVEKSYTGQYLKKYLNN